MWPDQEFVVLFGAEKAGDRSVKRVPADDASQAAIFKATNGRPSPPIMLDTLDVALYILKKKKQNRTRCLFCLVRPARLLSAFF